MAGGEVGKAKHMEKVAQGRRRYIAGDTIEVRVVLAHAANLREVRVVFTHEDGESYIMGRSSSQPIPASHERSSGGPVSSVVKVEIELRRGVTPGLYVLTRVGYETAGGRLGHLEGRHTPDGGAPVAFEVIRESTDTPKVLDVAFADE